MSVAELWAGALPPEARFLDDLFDQLICLPVTREVCRQAGEYLSSYQRSHAVELGDALIAAGAAVAGALLCTRDRKHYPMKDVAFYEPRGTK